MGRLRALGYRVHAVPTVATEVLRFEPPDVGRFDWVVVTSAAGVRALLDAVPRPTRVRWAAVGPRTASALAAKGLTASAVPLESRGLRIAEAIAAVEPLAGLRVLLARADAAAGDLPEALREAGALVEEVAVYHTVIGPEASRAGVRAALADPDLAAVVFASGSAAEGLVRLGGEGSRQVPAVTIGPATTAAARLRGFEVVAEASRPDVEALASAVLRHRKI